jgi:hypothetical protein
MLKVVIRRYKNVILGFADHQHAPYIFPPVTSGYPPMGRVLPRQVCVFQFSAPTNQQPWKTELGCLDELEDTVNRAMAATRLFDRRYQETRYARTDWISP